MKAKDKTVRINLEHMHTAALTHVLLVTHNFWSVDKFKREKTGIGIVVCNFLSLSYILWGKGWG